VEHASHDRGRIERCAAAGLPQVEQVPALLALLQGPELRAEQLLDSERRNLRNAIELNMLAVTGDHKCKRQNAKCKVQSGQASWFSATIRLRTRLRRDFGDDHV
jgi:hypothetical protein